MKTNNQLSVLDGNVRQDLLVPYAGGRAGVCALRRAPERFYLLFHRTERNKRNFSDGTSKLTVVRHYCFVCNKRWISVCAPAVSALQLHIDFSCYFCTLNCELVHLGT